MIMALLPRTAFFALLAFVAPVLSAGGCAPIPPIPPLITAACTGTLVTSTLGSVASPAVVELSGLVASRITAGVFWVHNDSGDSARVFAVGDDGRDLGAYTLSGASAIDWEDIATGPGPSAGVTYLYVGDTGDNAHARASVQVYRVAEPPVDTGVTSPPPQTLTGVAKLTFTYPDGPHDAEALLVDPVSGEMFVVTKDTSGIALVFRAPANLAGGSTTALTLVATLELGSGHQVTGGDISPSGDVVALRTYVSVRLFNRSAGKPLEKAFWNPLKCDGATANEIQGEAIGITPDGLGYVTASEGAHPALHRFAAP
jgi:hypothetical protein